MSGYPKTGLKLLTAIGMYKIRLKAGTQCKRLKDHRQVVYYISKYMAKEDDEKLKNQGRYWGASVNWEDFLAEDKLEVEELIVFRRLLKNYLKRRCQIG
ncbi:MAG: hypothetical protein U5K69_00475 [Balneolaceae bacterium]|nr:hypothetical protein [Balneolaceae bacterium]